MIVYDDYEDQMGHLPDLVAVDYLGYWAQGIKGKDRYEQVGNAVMALKGIAKDRKIAMIAPHQVNRSAEFGGELSIDQARDSGAVEETADFALGMWAPDTMKGVASSDMSGELVLKIGKTRHGGKHQEMRLQFGQMTLTYVPVEEHKHVHMLKNELKWAEDPLLTWQDAIHAHRTGIPLKRGL
jgi:replicative DNA helicase